MKGKLIVFEGIDGSGKTTQMQILGRRLERQGFPVVYTREPGGTRVGESIRGILLDPLYREMEPQTEALLYAAARAQHVAQLLQPALAAGKVVLCDRFLGSSLAYQGFGRGLSLEFIDHINNLATGGLKPDLVLIFDLSPCLCLKRIGAQVNELDRLEREEMAFHRRVREGYLTLARREPACCRVIDGRQTVEQVHETVWREVERFLREANAGNK
jgi:dTMP kinase